MANDGRCWVLTGLLALTVGLVIGILGLVTFPSVAQAEEFDITHCYSGTGTVFHKSKEMSAAVSWKQDGIIMSDQGNTKFDNVVVHCEGIQAGVGEKRKGYGLCTWMDTDGDLILVEWGAPYVGFVAQPRFLEGTGKWKGIKGSYQSIRGVRSKPGKGAMPGTYQGCRHNKGTFELPK